MAGRRARGLPGERRSAVGLGRFAGAGVAGDDLAAVFYDRAGMTLLQGTQTEGTPTIWSRFDEQPSADTAGVDRLDGSCSGRAALVGGSARLACRPTCSSAPKRRS